jgi:hypothetical protein
MQGESEGQSVKTPKMMSVKEGDEMFLVRGILRWGRLKLTSPLRLIRVCLCW